MGMQYLKFWQRKIYIVFWLFHTITISFALSLFYKKYKLEVIPFKANRSYPHEPSDWWHQFEWENFNRLKTVAHEYVGIIIYKLTNKI